MTDIVRDDKAQGVVARVDHFLERMITAVNPYHPSKLRELDLQTGTIDDGPVRRRALWLIVITVLIFLVWSATAPLDAGSQLSGQVTVAGYRKAVQHPTGGVVTRVLVSEGAHVVQGQTLVQINPLDSDANVANLEQEYINTLVSESRDKAEFLDRPIVWDPELASLNPKRVAEAEAIQMALYRNRRSAFQEQIRGLQAQLAGQGAAIVSHQAQLDTLSQELNNAQDLQKQGFLPKAQANITIRDHADQQAQLESAQASIGKTKTDIAAVRSQYLSDIAKDMADLEKTRNSLAPQLRVARYSQSLTSIRAPVTGTVVNLKVYTEGGVIGSGDTLMEIVPDKGLLLVEAKVPPDTIDSIKVGAEADVQFPILGATITPTVYGKVRAVGIDQLKAMPGQTLQDNEDYYLAQVEVTPDALKVLNGQPLHPGMPAYVIIRKGERTFLSYLFKPTVDTMVRAFRE